MRKVFNKKPTEEAGTEVRMELSLPGETISNDAGSGGLFLPSGDDGDM